MDRRGFLKSSAAVGAGMVFTPRILAQGKSKTDDINVALLGAGAEGQVLLDACLAMGKDSGIRFKAVCDIWESYNLKRVSRMLKAYKHVNNKYVDYQEMLAKEKDLDAVIIATPDFWHAPHTIACLKAGLHVYCEKEMSNTLEGAKSMVKAAKETGKLLQIGHQRRSNPRYLHCYNKLLNEAHLLGRITAVNGQWNRSAKPDLAWPKKAAIDQATLEKYGYKDMHAFRNWRWYKGLGGGPIVDLGSHQIDIYNWFLGTHPRSVIASGSTEYYPKDTHQWYDTVMTVYEYPTKTGVVRAFYQTLTTNSYNGYYEAFMGDKGTLNISEAASRGAVYPEPSADDWSKWVKMGWLKEPEKKEKKGENALLDVRETGAPPAYEIPVKMDQKYHQPHLANFFSAIRGKAKLNCPADEAYVCTVSVLKVNDAIVANRRLEFKPEEFKV